jgi:serine-type D-Ala-D-Ala endopeptidase (penicillin-binding protein 7)
MKILIAILLTVNLCWAKSAPKVEPSIVVFNNSTGHTLLAHNEELVRPLASITKLMTALVALDTGYALDRTVPLNKRWGGILPVKAYTRRDLFTAMLIRSDNSAAETLAGDYPGGREEFIIAMNYKARDLGMTNTHFDDASGLVATNTTTARDLQLLLAEALKWQFIRDLTTTRHTEIIVAQKQSQGRVVVNNTNSPLLGTFDSAILGKTGLTNRAGWCVAMVLEEQGQRYSIIVLGAATKAQRTKMVEQAVYSKIR